MGSDSCIDALLSTFGTRRIRHCREFFDAMNFNGRSILFVALGCGLTFVPASGYPRTTGQTQSLQNPAGRPVRARNPIL